MISSLLVEAALRSILLAAAVWIGLRMLGVRNVPAQKAVWGLVLAGALLMPMALPIAAHWSVLPANVRVVLPADPHTLLEELQARIQAKASPAPESKADATSTDKGGDKRGSHADRQMTLTGSGPAFNGADSLNEASQNEPSLAKPAEKYVVEHQYVQTTLQTAPGIAAPPRKAFSLSKMILALYVAVAGIFLFRLALGLAAARGLWRRAQPIDAQLIEGQWLTGQNTALDLRCSAEVLSPVTIGSAIVLPIDYVTWDAEKLRVVLAHERSHIRQKDFYLQLLAGAYAATVWFSPLGWWLKGKLSELAEAISDRAGLEEAADPASYAQILLEFAAAPRPTRIGVAMARSGSVSRRIERLLNDASFRQAFAGSRRALAAVVFVPIALFAATALVRVEAAGQQAPSPPLAAPDQGTVAPPSPAVQPPTEGVSNPSPAAAPSVPNVASPVAPAPPEQSTPPQDVHVPPIEVHVRPVHVHVPATDIHVPAVNVHVPATDIHVPPINVHVRANDIHIPPISVHVPANDIRIPEINLHTAEINLRLRDLALLQNGQVFHGASGYHYSYSSDGEAYAILRGTDKGQITFSGDWVEGRREELDKARKAAGGKDILWFTRKGKSYFVDDSSVIAQIEAMYKPMEALGIQQEALGKEQAELGKQQEALGRQQEKASVPTPDMSKEIAEIDEAMARLKADQGKTMNEEQSAELQAKLGDLQGKLGEIQGRIGSRQGEFGDQMGKLGAMQGELGAKQGRLGEEQGRIAQEVDRKVKSIIDDSLKNGSAHPVQ